MEQENPFGNEPLHIPSERSDHYFPQELGLVESNEADRDLYTESKGIREAGELLLERRKLIAARDAGEISAEHYDLQRKAFDEVLEQIFAEHEKEAP